MFYNPNNGEFIYGAAATASATVNTKTFVIDHPIYEDRYLVHGCLEGPESGVYYRGKDSIKKGNLREVIRLPEYTKAFKDFTAHVTCIGTPVLLGVSEVQSGYFIVSSNVNVITETFFNWVVYGTRDMLCVEPEKEYVTVKGDGPYRYISGISS
jgi:hypothetical protein